MHCLHSERESSRTEVEGPLAEEHLDRAPLPALVTTGCGSRPGPPSSAPPCPLSHDEWSHGAGLCGCAKDVGSL